MTSCDLIGTACSKPKTTIVLVGCAAVSVVLALFWLSPLRRSAMAEALSDPTESADLPPVESGQALQPILAAGEAIRSLHKRMPPPKPGEWLATHAEPGQSFEAYRGSSPNRPGGARTTLYIQPLGTPPRDQRVLIADTAEMLGRFYGLPVKTLEPIDLSGLPARARRLHPTWGVQQIDSLYLLGLLKPQVPTDAVAVLGLTAEDLWPNESGKKWNFVFGQASLRDRVGVWSTNRLASVPVNRKLLRLRTLKVAVHETGHMLGIQHCTAYECGMNGSNHLEESDRQPLGFCPECEMKVWWACRLDPIRRYEQLAAFTAEKGIEEAATGWQAAAARIRECVAKNEERP